MPIGAGVQPVIAVADRGKASGGSLATLVDTGKSWPVDVWRGCALNLFLGPVLATHRIASNTANTLTFEPANVPIVAGTQYFIVGNVSIQAADVVITAQVAGVYLEPEWQTKEGKDKTFLFTAPNVAIDASVSGLYAVPPGKTLFLTSFQASTYASAAADADKPQHFLAGIWTDSGTFDVRFGGDGGEAVALSKSLRTGIADNLNFYLYNYSNHVCNLGINAQGYEI